MSVAEQYRNQAEQCRLRAENSSKPADRAFWLLLAENWQKLAQDSDEPRRTEAAAAAEY
jgi:hypothetical protein